MAHLKTQQSGAVLVVSLMLLVVLMLLSVSAINSSTVNLRIVDNIHSRQQAEAAAQLAIDEVLEDPANFSSPQDLAFTLDGHAIVVTAADCIRQAPAAGWSATYNPFAPVAGTRYDTDWQVNVAATGATAGQVTLNQGARRLNSLTPCPLPAP